MFRSPEIRPAGAAAASRERSRRLEAKIAAVLAREGHREGGGWQLESRSDSRAVLVRKRRVNHRLHLILTLATLGLWVFVWMVVAAHSNEPQRKVIKV